jgi:hypothetical protein
MKKVQERSADDHSSTYTVSVVGVESRVMDEKISTLLNVDGSSALEVVCGGPGNWSENSRKFFQQKVLGWS